MSTGTERYNSVAQAFHWLVAALVATQFALIWSLPDGPPGPRAQELVNLHMSIGVTVLC